MKYERILPADFDGVFRFTNWSDEDFIGKWSGKEYKFPAESTSPMIIPEHSPLEIQHIRKKFAKDLAEREFFKGDKYKSFQKQERGENGMALLNGIHQAVAYTLDDLASNIQRCLVPLEIKEAFVRLVQAEPIETKLTRDEEGQLNTRPVRKGKSLKELSDEFAETTTAK